MNTVYTVKDIASILRVHYNTVYRWLYTNKLVGFKANRMWRITGKSLEDFTKRGAGVEQAVSKK